MLHILIFKINNYDYEKPSQVVVLSRVRNSGPVNKVIKK